MGHETMRKRAKKGIAGIIAVTVGVSSTVVMLVGEVAKGPPPRVVLSTEPSGVDYSDGPVGPLVPLEPAFVDRELGNRLPEAPAPSYPSAERVGVVDIPPRGNDAFRRAYAIDAFDFRGRTAGVSTLEPGEPEPPCGAVEGTLWYALTTGVEATLRADTIGSAVDTVLAVYADSSQGRDGFHALKLVGCHDDVGRPNLSSVVSFVTNTSSRYLFQVGVKSSNPGEVSFNLTRIPPAGRNDSVAHAAPVGVLVPAFAVVFSPLGASVEPGEPNQCTGYTYDRTVWYSVTLHTAARVVIDTRTSLATTTLGLFAPGSTASSALPEVSPSGERNTWAEQQLQRIACNVAAPFPMGGSRIVRLLETGTYYVQVGVGAGEPSNEIALHIGLPAIPANDVSDRAQPIAASPWRHVPGLASLMTLDPGEAQPCGALRGSVWYRYRALADGALAIDTDLSAKDLDATLAVFEVSRDGELNLIDCSDDGAGADAHDWKSARLAFRVRAHQEYRIQLGIIDPSPGRTGGGPQRNDALETEPVFRVRAAAPPANDQAVRAVRIAGNRVHAEVSSLDATDDADEPVSSCGAAAATLWWSVRSERDEVLVAAAAAPFWLRAMPGNHLFIVSGGKMNKRAITPGFPVVVAVYERAGPKGFLEVACGDDREGVNGAMVLFEAKASRTYYVQVGGLADRIDYATAVRSPQGWGASRGSLCFEMRSLVDESRCAKPLRWIDSAPTRSRASNGLRQKMPAIAGTGRRWPR